ncbi:MAG: BrnT family toxin [Elusimicrobia bacterium]|nr:BrnT family toxin [Elusimicrobiota bacterium]MBP9127993.1 BrnT family toxin [Elusimicrobiota bacterium]MBP9698978.1 BrnT family toxin [Elusimicrobiota bacterium]
MLDYYALLLGCAGFEWDKGNLDKNWLKHRVAPYECEQIFFNQPLIVAEDERHSRSEPRFFALGQTDAGRPLFAVFTVRRHLIRVISARDMSAKERGAYKNHEE